MRLDSSTRTRILADMTLDFDPAGSTIRVDVDGVEYPAEWQDTPVEGVGGRPPRPQWTQTARTVDYFAGPAHPLPDGAVVLTAGRHNTQTLVALGGDTIARNSTPVDVI